MSRLKKLKKIHIHREGTHTLAAGLLILLCIDIALYIGFDNKIPFYIAATLSLFTYGTMVNFFRCPIRLFGEDTEKVVVAPADGKVVVVEDGIYFHESCQCTCQLVSGGRRRKKSDSSER